MLNRVGRAAKKGLGVKYLQGLAVVILVAACGHKSNPPPEPCSTGVNEKHCQLQIVEPSVWTEKLQTYNQDPKTQQKIPTSVRDITVVYEFFPQGDDQRLRRTMLIESQSGNTGMFEEGRITKIDPGTFEFAIDRTSCDDSLHIEDPGGLIYYRRFGGSLSIDHQPFKKRVSHGLFDAFGNLMAEMMERSIRAMLESAFTFGSARSYLTSGEGSLKASQLDLSKEIQTKNITVGCFSTVGEGFNKSDLQPNWGAEPTPDNLVK